MKMIKKVLAAVLAMAMVIGMMAMTAFAKDLTFTVKWDEAAGEDMNCWIWFPDDILAGLNISEVEGVQTDNEYQGGWPGYIMTKGDGVWTISFTNVPGSATAVNFIPSCSLGQTVDIKDIDASTGNILITVGEKNDEDKYEGTGEAVAAEEGGNEPAGDSSLMIYVVAAVVALAGVVTVVCKRRSVEA